MDTNQLLDEYTTWLRTQYHIKSINNADEITTPFINSIGDNMRIYVQPLTNNKIQISDDGITLEDLELSGLELSNYRKELINSVKKQFSIDQLDDVLSVSGNISDFPIMKQRLTSAILRINDLVYTKKKNIDNMFFEDVYQYLDENDFGGLSKHTYEGYDGVPFVFNYVIPSRQHKPTRIIDFQNKISSNEMMISAYKFDQIQNSSQFLSKPVSYSIIYNNQEANPSKNSNKIALNSGIKLYTWSDRETLLELR